MFNNFCHLLPTFAIFLCNIWKLLAAIVMSPCLPVILSSCHLVILSFFHPVILSLVILISCNFVIPSFCHLVSLSAGQVIALSICFLFILCILELVIQRGINYGYCECLWKNLCRILNGYWRFLNANSKHWFWPDTHIELSSNYAEYTFSTGKVSSWQKCDFSCINNTWFSAFLIHIFLYKRCLIFWLQIWFVSHFALDWTSADSQKMQSNQFFVFTLCRIFSFKLMHFQKVQN